MMKGQDYDDALGSSIMTTSHDYGRRIMILITLAASRRAASDATTIMTTARKDIRSMQRAFAPHYASKQRRWQPEQ